MTELKNIWTLLRYNTFIKINEITSVNFKIRKIFLLWFMSIGIALIFSPILKLIDNIVCAFLNINSILDNINNKSSLFLKTKYLTIVYLLFLGPVIEETIFRFLFNFKKISIAIFCFGVSFLYFQVIFYDFLNIKNINIFVLFIFSFILGVLVYFKINNKWFIFFKTRCFLISNIILFGFIHILNRDITYSFLLIPIYFLLTINKMIFGLILTYTRIQYGFSYGIILHSLFNLLSAITILFKY